MDTVKLAQTDRFLDLLLATVGKGHKNGVNISFVIPQYVTQLRKASQVRNTGGSDIVLCGSSMKIANSLKSQIGPGQQGPDNAPTDLAGAYNQSPINPNAAPVLHNQYRAA
jgi:hypothetical protein